MRGRTCLAAAILVTGTGFLAERASAFDAAAYRAYLERTRDMTAAELIESRRPYGPYRVDVPTPAAPPEYLEPIAARLHLTTGERQLLDQHGFVVSERLAYPSFGDAFHAIWHADIPVFVSTDAILHALHRSYDDILKSTEETWMAPAIGAALGAMHAAWPALAAAHAGEARMQAPLADVDVYLAVARSLLAGQPMPTYGGNDAAVASLLDLVAAGNPATIPLFNNVPRDYDFSQLKPRGHYTDTPELRRYFQAMMWLGRTEFRLTEPPGEPATPDVTREILGAFLVRELAREPAATGNLAAMDRFLRALIGAADNVTLPELDALATALGLSRPEELLVPDTMRRFRSELATGRYTAQGINSQILISDPMQPDRLDPPYAFLLLGQRFILDSYITWNVVYDRIEYQGQKVFRGLPSTLDILYALGNDDVLQLLRADMERYHYAPNLGALRYLVDSYEPDYWRQSLYTAWLQSIRTLALSGRDRRVPAFMRTVAWQQEKMNTQLASWTELRHDNLLYAKQSYSGGTTCSFPRAYVEPVPELYRTLERFARDAGPVFDVSTGPVPNDDALHVRRFFQRMAEIQAQLAQIAEKELDGTAFTPAEQEFLCNVLYRGNFCGVEERGWYPELYFDNDGSPTTKVDLLVADVHTQPTDADGNPVGYVLHGATGNPEMGVFVATPPGQPLTAFAGPVSTFHENVTWGFRRLTDAEWRDLYLAGPLERPDWTHVYLADAAGNVRTTGRRLVPDPTSAGPPGARPARLAVRLEIGRNVPNPFNPSTRISFRLDAEGGADVRLEVYDTRGRLVRVLMQEHLPSGTHLATWDGTDVEGKRVHSGIYYLRAQAGEELATRKVVLLE